MVAGRVKAAMGFQRSPATPKAETPRRSSASPVTTKSSAAAAPATGNSNSSSKAASAFARSIGVYFPARSTAQVQPQPRQPEVGELVRLVEQLQERESRLRTELLEQKILKETVSIVPFLESELAVKSAELDRAKEMNAVLDAENAKLRDELAAAGARAHLMEKEITELKRAAVAALTSEQSSSASDSSRLSMEACSSSRSIDGSQNTEKKTQLPPMRPSQVPKPPPLPEPFTSKSYRTPSQSSFSSSSSSCSAEMSASSKSRPLPSLSSLPPISPPPGVPPAAPPPPPPPPPPSRSSKSRSYSSVSNPVCPIPGPCVRRVPEVVEFYHSLMRRDSKRESAGSGAESATAGAPSCPRDMIGEIENRSSHLLAIKTDVETQGEFIRFLIKEVQNATFNSIEDVVTFVKWLDVELSGLVDERAVLKHFEWPEQKADALREAAFGYCDLKKLETEASSFSDDPRQPCSSALKKMQALFEKLEHGVYTLARMREGAASRYKGFRIPCDWMSENGIPSQIKLASVKLAMKYLRRVSSELQALLGSPDEEELMLQGVRFAFRVHQFAGGFDADTMRAFQELKEKASLFQLQRQSQNQHMQQRLSCRTS